MVRVAEILIQRLKPPVDKVSYRLWDLVFLGLELCLSFKDFRVELVEPQ